MLVYIGRRLLWLPVLMFIVSLITFTLGRFGPGDPVEIMMGNRYDPVVAARIRHSMGLDRPFLDYPQRRSPSDVHPSARHWPHHRCIRNEKASLTSGIENFLETASFPSLPLQRP